MLLDTLPWDEKCGFKMLKRLLSLSSAMRQVAHTIIGRVNPIVGDQPKTCSKNATRADSQACYAPLSEAIMALMVIIGSVLHRLPVVRRSVRRCIRVCVPLTWCLPRAVAVRLQTLSQRS